MMATFEERLTAIEQEYVELKQDHAALREKIDLQTMAIGGLVNKALLERLNERNDKIFQTLIAHDELANRQLSDLRERVEVQVEGKIAGMQTEMRQHFEQQDKQIADVRGALTVQGQKLDDLNARFDQQSKLLFQILDRLPPS
ncbi:MAG TPA: hypothetical protein VF043_09670 [Ktedonobacteraceae bacterium]